MDWGNALGSVSQAQAEAYLRDLERRRRLADRERTNYTTELYTQAANSGIIASDPIATANGPTFRQVWLVPRETPTTSGQRVEQVTVVPGMGLLANPPPTPLPAGTPPAETAMKARFGGLEWDE